MIFHNAKAEHKVYSTDQGWIVEWEQAAKPQENELPEAFPRPRRGILVFTDKKKLLKFLSDNI